MAATGVAAWPGTASDRVVVILRHGVTAANAAGVLQGQHDVPLHADGVAQAHRTAVWLEQVPWGRVVSSDLVRASATAQIVAGDRPVILDPRCREIHLGAWQGRDKAEVLRSDPAAVLHREGDPDVRRGGTGETLREVSVRMQACLADHLTAAPVGAPVLVVSHGYASGALVAALLGWEPSTYVRALAPLHNCCAAVLRDGRSGWQLLQWNVSADQDLGIGEGIG